MTPEEKTLLNDFLSRLVGAGNVQADPEATMLIARAAGQQPAALYLTVQRAVWLEHALNEAQGRIAGLEAAQAEAQARIRALEAAAPVTPSAPVVSANPWLSSTWGSGADNGRTPLPPTQADPGPLLPGLPQPVSTQPGTGNRGVAVPPPSGAVASPAPVYGAMGSTPPVGGMFGGGSFLGGGHSLLATIATTAAGVAVGSVIAEALTGGHPHGHGRDGLLDSPPLESESLPVDTDDLASLGDFDSDS